MDKTKVVSAETMDADTFFKHIKTRHPGLILLYPHLPELRNAHRDEHELTPKASYTHYHEECTSLPLSTVVDPEPTVRPPRRDSPRRRGRTHVR